VKNLAISVFASFVMLANAQADDRFDGKWVAEWKSPAGRPASADLQLKDGTGSWQVRVLSRIEDPCPKLVAPASVQGQDPEAYLAVEYSKVLTGCRDVKIKLAAPAAAGVLKANFGDGREVVLKKQ
jgi:hypothetical protein